MTGFGLYIVSVTSREGRVSRNHFASGTVSVLPVTSREGRVSRNVYLDGVGEPVGVTSREGRVSRNSRRESKRHQRNRHVP